ncbi:hypothetical protein [Novosphingobium pentaromativorans]|uniref:Uncharacterized protein n=1 Tax=Novosphingobium pentaromativorans US6-1 TaxID=1088721 RepID=G6E8R9_9SPHN|nr:hypothetical protein [Novosphingobium pentaromativorans]AIT81248.1 hypothetical protein JI59_16410 [Novosphingobium pentaromativorans US6-1]EHJ62143.1 hypothetical protein NSU_0740 [Novosphingobium pentaromativorans US6-1]
MKIPRLRNRNGKFLRKLVRTPEGQHCWLIWSRRWHMWHRRDFDGLTKDIGEAGMFPYSKALAYHDGENNEAFHVSDKVDLIEHRREELQRLLFGIEEMSLSARQVAA